METFRIVTLIIQYVLLIIMFVMIFILRKRVKEYNEAESFYKEGLAMYKEQKEYLESLVREWMRQHKTLFATYKFTESDFNKFGNNHQGMEKEAKQRMACALGRRIIKDLGATEIVEDGVLAGYRIDVEIRKAQEYRENPILAKVKVEMPYRAIFNEANQEK